MVTDVSTTLTVAKVIFRVKEEDSGDYTYSLHSALQEIISRISRIIHLKTVKVDGCNSLTVNMGLFLLQSAKVSDPVRLFSLLSLGEIGRHMYVQM